jgi:hypothetical protein
MFAHPSSAARSLAEEHCDNKNDNDLLPEGVSIT